MTCSVNSRRIQAEGERLEETIFPAIIDNAHWNRIAALAQALLEMKGFGRQYANQVIRNSRALGEAMDELGIPVRCKDYGYTASHQVLLDMDRLKDGASPRQTGTGERDR